MFLHFHLTQCCLNVCACWCRHDAVWDTIWPVYAPRSSCASRSKHTPTHVVTKRDPERGNCYKLTLMECWTAWKINTRALSSGLIWAAAPSVSPTHTVGQHNGAVCTHSNIQLTGEEKQAMGEEITPWSLLCYQSAHAAASTPFLTLFTPHAPHFRIENKTRLSCWDLGKKW